ncbi:MAG: ATP-binding protein [Thermoanaerobaculia bacterium]|jgi:PAS domain S-box-containing protein
MTPAEIGPSAGDDSQFDDAPAQAVAFDNSLFLQILETVPFGLFVLNGEGTPVYANSRAVEILGKGISPETRIETLAKSYAAYVAGTDEPYPVERMPIVRALAGERSSVSDIEIRRHDGTICLEVTGAPLLDAEGRVKHAIAVFHDITVTRSVELALRRLASDLDARVHERTEQLELLQRAAELSHGLPPEPDCESVPEADSGELIEPCGRCIVFREVEELRENAKLANQALNLFIANFSHELRTPLNHIIGFSDLIESKIQNGVTQGIEKHAGIIRASGASLLDTLDKLITVAEIEAREKAISLSIIDVAALLRDIEARFAPDAAQKGNRFDLRIHGELGLAQSDAARIRTAVEQIVENACKHCSDCSISIQASRRGDGESATIEIEVSDTGPGIDPGRAARLARGEVAPGDPLRDGGLGLGIPLAVQSLRPLGGTLTFTTVQGGGTRFVISIPTHTRD